MESLPQNSPRVPLYPRWVTWALAVTLVVVLLLYIYPASAAHDFPFRLATAISLATVCLVYSVSETIRHQGRMPLRALFALVALVAIVSSVAGLRILKARKQIRFRNAATAMGADVGYDGYVRSLTKDLVTLPNDWVLPKWLVDLVGDDFFTRLTIANFDPARVEDKDILSLDFSDVEEVFLSNQDITDRSLEHLSKFVSIRHVWVPNTGITDHGVQKLLELPQLEGLSLGNTKITVATLKRIAKVENLAAVDLRNLQGIRGDDVQVLRDARPGLVIFNDFGIPQH